LIDRATFKINYLIRKKLRISDEIKSWITSGTDPNFGLHANYFTDGSGPREPFALMHRVYG
jgi:hypothetical protein